jgi:hypothetical protein
VGEKKAAIQQQIDGLVARASISSELDGDYGVVWMHFSPFSSRLPPVSSSETVIATLVCSKNRCCCFIDVTDVTSHVLEFYALEWCLI